MRRRWRILIASLLIDWRGVRTCCRLATTRKVGLGIRGVLLLVRGRGFPSARAILHALSCFAFLFLFLSAAASAASFRLFTTSA